jgi:hypothetical protein
MTAIQVWIKRIPKRIVLMLGLIGALTFLVTGAQSPLAQAEPAAEIGEFVAFCDFSHRAMDDPIVFPGLPGASHNHDFFGSVVADAAVTLEAMLAGDTTCDPVGDRSSYWVPTLYDGDGNPVDVEHGTFYYLVHIDEPATLQPYPLGLKVIAGNGGATKPSEAAHIKWSCLGSAVSSTTGIVQCPAGSRLELLLNFPDCWNGVDLDSDDHKSHMAYSVDKKCPASHPVAVPALQYKLRYASEGGADFTLSSGPGYTFHGDFFNAWEPAALANRLNCLHNLVKCGPEGFPQAETLPHRLYLPALQQ